MKPCAVVAGILTVLFSVSCATKTAPEPAAAGTAAAVKPEQGFTSAAFMSDVHDALSAGTVADALALFSEIPEEHKQDVDLNLIQASLLVSSGDVSGAAEVGAKLQEQHPDNIDILVLNSMVAKAQGNTAKKSALIDEILKKDPQNTDALLELGHEQMMKRNFRLANTYYRRSMNSNPDNLEAVFGYGQSAYYIGNLKDARGAFESIVEKDDKNGLAYLYLGKLEVEKERYAAAAAYAEKAIACDDTYYDFWIDYGNYLGNLGKLDEAVNALSRATALNPDNFLGFVYRAALYDEMDKCEEALADYRRIEKLNPKYNYVHEARGVDAWHLGYMEEARNAFMRASDMDPKNIAYKLMISATYIKEGKKTENKTFLDRNLRNMDRQSAEYALLRLYLDGYGPSSVEQKIRRTQSTAQKSKMLFYLGLFYEINGDDLMAKKYYAELHSTEAPMYFEYRMMEWALKQ